MTITEKSFGLFKSLLILHEEKTDRLLIRSALGYNAGALSGVEYTPGEGIVGQTFLKKSAVYVPNASRDSRFLNRLRVLPETRNSGFYCCPIFAGNQSIGVLASFTNPQVEQDANYLLEFFQIIASFISRSVTIQKLIQDEKRDIVIENQKLRRELSEKYKFGNLIGRATITEQLFEKVQIIADSRATVLLTGESGTGKELFASAIHYNSPRRDAPFIKVNCAAIPENLLESELFGHKKGSFTGAIADKKGKFLSAHEGSIFLDEIGEMDMNLQSKLLRVLQEREIEPVGGVARKIDIRVIAATNADLEQLIIQKKFRADLFYRLNVISLSIPPLRDRKEDILPLLSHFIKKYNKENSKNISDITPQAIAVLENHSWPGNIRQLENMIERAVVLCQNNVLDVEDFKELISRKEMAGDDQSMQSLPGLAPVQMHTTASHSDQIIDSIIEKSVTLFEEQSKSGQANGLLKYIVAKVEKRLILFALKKFRYTKIKASGFLGINRNTLDNKIRELEIKY